MPNDHHWSASMVLQWVLTRDIEAVLSMADTYGGWRVDGESAARIQPPTLNDVLRAHSIDESLTKDERAREAAVRRITSFVLPARQEIFHGLRSGAISGWARPNGSGDIAKIDAIQWAGLRFRDVNGHDIAVPVDSVGEALKLPRPLADYLAGAVSAHTTPTVWPDPVFPAELAMSLWRKDPSVLGEQSAGHPAFGHSAEADLRAARSQKSEAAQIPEVNERTRRHGPIATATTIRAVAHSLVAAGKVPGRTVTWKQFQTDLCREIGVKPGHRGYSLDTIQAAVWPLLPIPNTGNIESTEN